MLEGAEGKWVVITVWKMQNKNGVDREKSRPVVDFIIKTPSPAINEQPRTSSLPSEDKNTISKGNSGVTKSEGLPSVGGKK